MQLISCVTAKKNPGYKLRRNRFYGILNQILIVWQLKILKDLMLKRKKAQRVLIKIYL